MGVHLGLSTLASTLAAPPGGPPGVVSIWCGPVGGPATVQVAADFTHYAASTMKVAVLAALYRAAARDVVDLDEPVRIHNHFTSATGDGQRFGVDPDDDSDPAVWACLDATASLGWLAQRMIIRSSNLATNLVMERIGVPAVAEVWQLAGATASTVTRGIDDAAARAAGLHNLVTAADLARLFGALAADRIASPAACRAMLDVLAAQEYGEHLAAGLPAGVRVAHKDGWDSRVRHAAGVVYPPDAPAYLLAVCTTGVTATDGGTDDAAAGDLITRISATAWHDRMGGPR
jgi:beta-lactamase class A